MQRGKGLSRDTSQGHVCIELRLVPGLEISHSGSGIGALPQGSFPVTPRYNGPGMAEPGMAVRKGAEPPEALVSTTHLEIL